MNTGLLFYEPNPKLTLETKVAQAVAYYRRKLGAAPTECHVHPALMPDGVQAVAGVKLCANRTIIKDHFWLGVNTGETA